MKVGYEITPILDADGNKKGEYMRYYIINESGVTVYYKEGPRAVVESEVSSDYKKILMLFRS
jgi:hypothetical protein